MNKNPLLIKSSLTGQIPFMKGRTLALYKKFISENKFQKVLRSLSNGQTEILSAYTMNSEYKTDFVFDGIEVTPSIHFSEEEWIALGMLLRAHKEVDGINLLHLYNCLFRASGKIVYGHVVTGRTYTLYTSTQLPLKIRIIGISRKPMEIQVNSLNTLNPYTFRVPSKVKEDTETGEILEVLEIIGNESLVEIEIEFSSSTYQPSTLVEGIYDGLLSTGETYVLRTGPTDKFIPQPLGIGEYSERLVEFFAGTLVTKLSNPKVISIATQQEVEVIPKFYNNDGFIGKEVQL